MADEVEVVDPGRARRSAVDPSVVGRTTAALRGVFPAVAPDTLASLLDRAEIGEYPDGATICTQGAYEDTFYVILAGRVEVWVYELGEGVLVTHLSEGESIGELELLIDSPRNADVVAAGPVTLLELDYADLDIDQHPEAYQALARAEIGRLIGIQRERVHEVAESLRRRENLDEMYVCRSIRDEAFARRLAANLVDHRVKVWLDEVAGGEAEPAKSRQRQVGEALDRCKVMLLVMSPDSLESGENEDEWNYFLDEGKTIIPILHRSCRVPYRLNKYQYVDFESVEYERALDRLLATINSYYADAVAQAAPTREP